MAKLKVKGTVIKCTIASVLTAIGQITEFSHSGAESETYDATTIDTSGAGKEYSQTGYTEGGTFDFSMFYDVDLAAHQALTDLLTTPGDMVYNITFTDATPTTSAFTGAGLTFGFTGSMNDGLKADVSIKLTGLLAYST